jgi:hypothetical protein
MWKFAKTTVSRSSIILTLGQLLYSVLNRNLRDLVGFEPRKRFLFLYWRNKRKQNCLSLMKTSILRDFYVQLYQLKDHS